MTVERLRGQVMHYASAAVLAIFEAMVDALLAKKGPAQNISKRGLYLGRRVLTVPGTGDNLPNG